LKLSVVILNYNVRYFLELCIKSVQAALYNIDSEIIVIDNNSPDNSCEMLMQCFPEIQVIQNLDNLGFSKANNQGVKIAKGDYVCILNPDTVVAEDTFEKLLKFADHKDNLGIIGCKLIDGSGRFLPESKRNIPYVSVAILKVLGNSKRYYSTHISENEISKVDILVGAFMFLKRDVYNKIEGFDEDYFMYGEDIDLSYRVSKSGLDNYYYGATTAIHFKGESTLKDKNYAKRFFGAMQIFYKKHFKENLIFDALVWLGIRSVYLARKEPKKRFNVVKRYCLISDKKQTSLQNMLSKEMVLKPECKNFKTHDELIFDANYFSYKSIIETMATTKNDDLSYKIYPNNSNFIIGSDQKSSRGEIVVFN